MKESRATNKCYECGEIMEGRIEDYRYVESGLKSVILKNILVFHCGKCSAIVPEITGTNQLHLRIAVMLLKNEARLTGEEMRFLRKFVGYSATELARLAGTTKSVVSRWENRSTFGKDSDRMIRLICVQKLLRNCLRTQVGCPNDLTTEARNFSAYNLLDEMENMLRNLTSQPAKKKQTYLINPAELSEPLFVVDPENKAVSVQ